MEKSEKSGSVIAKAREKYSEVVALRAAMQAIPYVGSSLDTLLAGKAAQIHLERVENFASELHRRMERVEHAATNLEDEAFSDLIITTFEKVARARSAEKRSRFARIISRQVAEGQKWEEPENAVRLLGELEDIHVEVLSVALAAPPLEKVFEGLRVISIASSPIRDDGGKGPLALAETLPQYGMPALRMACAELLAKGLLHDEGIGRWDTGSMQYFVPTELADWFAGWIAEPERR